MKMTKSTTPFGKVQIDMLIEFLDLLGFHTNATTTAKKARDVYLYLVSEHQYTGENNKNEILNFVYNSDLTDKVIAAYDARNEKRKLDEETQEWFANIETEEVPQKPSKEERQRRHKELVKIVKDNDGVPDIEIPIDRDFTDDFIHKLEKRIGESFKTFFDQHTTAEHWVIDITKTDGSTSEIPLLPESIKRIMDDIHDGSIFKAFGENSEPTMTFSDTSDNPITDWYYISRLTFKKVDAKQFKILTGADKGRKKYKSRGGHFFKYFAVNVPKCVEEELLKCQMFTKPMFEDKTVRNNVLKDSCIVYALNQLGIETTELKYKITDRYILTHDDVITELLQDYDIFLNVHDLDPEATAKHRSRVIRKNSDGLQKADLNLFHQHYFLEGRSKITADFLHDIDNPNPDPERAPDKRCQNGKWRNTGGEDRRFIKYGDMVRWLWEHQHFRAMPFSALLKIPSLEVPDINKGANLKYIEKGCIRGPKPKIQTKKITNDLIYFADFEASTQGNHQEFMVCLSDYKGNTKTFRGVGCGKTMLESLPDCAVVYFHNLKYDINFMAAHGIRGNLIKKGKRCYV